MEWTHYYLVLHDFISSHTSEGLITAKGASAEQKELHFYGPPKISNCDFPYSTYCSSIKTSAFNVSQWASQICMTYIGQEKNQGSTVGQRNSGYNPIWSTSIYLKQGYQASWRFVRENQRSISRTSCVSEIRNEEKASRGERFGTKTVPCHKSVFWINLECSRRWLFITLTGLGGLVG